jgi:hypothetical protein
MDSRFRELDGFQGLLEGESVIQYTSSECLERILHDFRTFLKDEKDGSLIFKDVPYNTYEQLSNNKSSILFRSLKLYNDRTNVLRVKMVSRAHERAAARFTAAMAIKAEKMGVFEELTPEGSGEQTLGNFHKEPDGAWGPDDHPTCVLEVGLSEPGIELAMTAHGWIESPGSQISPAITIKICSNRAEITFQKWETADRQYSATRAGRVRQARMTEEVLAVSDPNHGYTASGSLHLSFSKLLERPPTPGTLEGDFIFTPHDLLVICTDVWRRQDFIPRGAAAQTG